MIVNSEKKAKECCCEIMAAFAKHKFIRVNIAKDCRTLRQNSYIYKMYDMMSKDEDLGLYDGGGIVRMYSANDVLDILNTNVFIYDIETAKNHFKDLTKTK